MSNTVNLNIRVDEQLKRSADNLFSELGMNTSTAINIFLRRCVRCGGIPFELRVEPEAALPKEEKRSLEEILTHFLDSRSRLTAFPAKRKMKLYSLCFFAEKFTPEKEYTESEVNDIICANSTFNDPATIRRELCSYGFLSRTDDCRVYSVVSPAPTLSELGL